MRRDAPRVVHVLDSLRVGGTENGVVNLINALDGDFRHAIVAMTETGPLAARLPGDVPVHVLGKRRGIDVPAIVRLAALLRRLGPDIVHTRNWGAFDAVPAARLVRVPRLIHGEHGREAADPEGLNQRRNRVRRLFAPLVDRFVAVSFDLTRWLAETVGIPPGKLVTIHNGVDTGRFSEEDRIVGRRAVGLPEDTVVVGTVGRLDPVKDQMGLLESFARLTRDHARAALVVVGDGPCREALEARAQRPDLAGRVHLLGERHDVPLLLRGLDIYVLPSIAEGISNTILEAMASGLPIIATRTGGNPELVDDGVTGTLFPVGDRGGLTTLLAQYIDSPELRELHGHNARRRAEKQWSLERMAADYRRLYEEVLTGRLRVRRRSGDMR